MTALARAATLVVALGASCAYAADIGYLAPPGVPATEFPSTGRPVAQIVSPSRSDEKHRDSLDEAGEIARLLELKPGMTVGDIGAGSGYHTVRLSHLVGRTGSVVAQDVKRNYLVELAKRTKRLRLTNVLFALGEPHDPMADTWRCSPHRSKKAENLPGISLRVGILPALAESWWRARHPATIV
jgi:hypothetical protein